MKTTTLKSLLVTLTLFLIISQSFAQDLVGMRIDVMGTQYSDQMWIFSVPTCTRGFDNGWDGYKMFGTSLAPQLFAMEPDAYFQVDAVPDMNNTYLGFKSGIDSVYTFTFTSQYLDEAYQHLYLIDSVANKTVDIFQSGTTYTFTAPFTDAPVRRFKIVTSLPNVVVPPAPVDTVATPVVVPPVVTPPVVVPPVVTPPVVVPPVVVPPADPKNKKDKDQPKKIKIYSSGKKIYIENPGKKGKMKLVHAVTGRTLKTADFCAQGTTIISADVTAGTYMVNGATDSDDETTMVILQ